MGMTVRGRRLQAVCPIRLGALDSRLRRPLHNLFWGMQMETGARTVNGDTVGGIPRQSLHSVM